MLKMNQEKRAELLHKEALCTDPEGDEVLVGLTLAESHFFLAHEEQPLESHAQAETAVYLQLKHNHLVARSHRLLDH